MVALSFRRRIADTAGWIENVRAKSVCGDLGRNLQRASPCGGQDLPAVEALPDGPRGNADCPRYGGLAAEAPDCIGHGARCGVFLVIGHSTDDRIALLSTTSRADSNSMRGGSIAPLHTADMSDRIYPDLRDIKLRLTWARESKSLRKADAARALDVSPGAVHQWENPALKTLPDLENLLKAAQVYGVDFAWLATGREPPTSGPCPTPATLPILDRDLLCAVLVAVEEMFLDEGLRPGSSAEKARFVLGCYDWLVENRDGMADPAAAVRHLRPLVRSVFQANR